MKNLNYVLVGLIPLVFSCKKEKPTAPVVEKPTIEKVTPYLKDSISFKLDGVSFVSTELGGNGIGNSGVDVKPYDKELVGRRSWGSIGNSHLYGEPDSLMYSVYKELNLSPGSVKITFAKKFNQNELTLYSNPVWAYPDNASLFSTGMKRFATDYTIEQNTDGIVMDFWTRNYPVGLTSYVPGGSILRKVNLGTAYIQKDSKFEVIKSEKINDKYLLVQAKFELNLYDESGKKYRVTDGFYQTITFYKLHVANGSFAP
ncbi:hypothetical protein ABIB40_001782 [Pedobacter sp. UYP30]|uniref:hypothetical protein n=1 Tax=Pedobacter sp. UYP30 TaxID=1756400 RepID=UPI00339A9B1F